MTQVAEFLGCPNIIAHAENVELMINGNKVRGTFMKNADGSVEVAGIQKNNVI